MDIKLTNSGAIPLKDFQSNQCFLVIEEANSLPIFLTKSKISSMGAYRI